MSKIILVFLLFFTSVNIYAQQEDSVQFSSDTLTIYGTLSMPDGQGPFPGVVLIHGSGPNDRDQTSTLSGGNIPCLYPGLNGKTIKNFKDIAEALSKNGIAVLRYDKRSYTYGMQLDQKTITPYDFIKDANGAVDFLKNQSKIDKSQIYVLGHSQGGNFVSMMGYHRTDIAGVIGMAAPASSIDSLLAYQIRYIARNCGDSAQGEQQAQQVLSIMSQIRNGTWNPNTPVLGAYPLFWKDWLSLTDSAVVYYQQMNERTLILQGEDDYNVPPEDGQKLEKQVTRPNFTVSFFDGLNHFFTTSTTPKVSEDVTNTIINWILNKSSAIQESKKKESKLKIRTLPSSWIIEVADEKIKSAKIYSTEGKQLYQTKAEKELQIDKQLLGNGILLMIIQTEKNTYTAKLVNDVIR